MAISLGSLYIELKANTAQFLDGMTKASVSAKAFGRDIETGFSKMGALFAPLGEMGQKLAAVFDMVGSSSRGALAEIGKSGALVGGLAGLTGGAAALAGTMFALADKASEVGAKIYEASEKTGISAAQMSGLMAITKETGGDFEALTTSLARAGANLQSGIIDPGGKAGKVLSQVMGGAKQLAAEGMKPMGDRIQDVLKHIFELNNTGERNLALSALLGRGWMNNVETLKVLAEQGYGPVEAAARRLGIFFDDDGARQAKQFQVEIASLKSELSGLGLTLGKSLLPVFSEFIINMAGAIPALEAFGLRVTAIGLALTGWGLPAAVKLWQEAGVKLAEANEISNQFAINAAKLAAGEKASAEETDKLTKGVRAHADALASLISREQEQLAMLNTNGNASAQLGVEYRHTVEEIQKAVAAGGSYKESLTALGLALDIYRKKLSDIKPVTPQGYTPEAAAEPALRMPSVPESILAPPPVFATQTLAQLAMLPHSMEATRVAERALRLETDLSSASFVKLAAAFPGLTEGEVAATAAGAKMIAELSKMDKIGSFADQFKEMTDSLILEGGNFGGNMLKIVGGSIDQIESKFAEMVVKGRANFRELGQSIEQEMVKATLQKGVSVLLSGITGGKLGGSKPDGTAGNPLHVVMASGMPGKPLGGLLGGLQGSEKRAAPGGDGINAGTGDAGAGGGIGGMMSALTSGFTSIFANLAKSMGSIFKGIGSIFGGGLAGGGDVRPNMGYLVGEKGPEFFRPKSAGTIVPHISAHEIRPVTIHVHQNIATPDVDSFRKSQSQLAGEAYRSMALAHARSNS